MSFIHPFLFVTQTKIKQNKPFQKGVFPEQEFEDSNTLPCQRNTISQNDSGILLKPL